MQAIRKRASFANITSALALFVALAGGSAAALSGVNTGKGGKGAGAPQIKGFNYAPSGDDASTILRAGELKLKAKCADQLNLIATTGTDNAELQSYGNLADTTDDDFDRGEKLEIFAGGTSIGNSEEQRDVVYRSPGGKTVALTYFASDDTPFGGAKACAVSGFATVR